MSRNDVAVGTDSDSVMFWARRAAGPVMGVRPRGAGSWEQYARPRYCGGDFFPGPRMIGSSAVFPLSNRRRHSSRRTRVVQVLLVHHLHEGGVVGPEVELAHDGNLI